MFQACGGYSMFLYCKYLGWTPEEVQAFQLKFTKEIQTYRIRTYNKFHRVWARSRMIMLPANKLGSCLETSLIKEDVRIRKHSITLTQWAKNISVVFSYF